MTQHVKLFLHNKWYLLLFKIEVGTLGIISVEEISRWDGLFIDRNLISSTSFILVSLKFFILIFLLWFLEGSHLCVLIPKAQENPLLLMVSP